MAKNHKDAEQGRSASVRRIRHQGRNGRLSRERVLATALELVDREGLSAMSMRRVGAELGVEAMTLYRYASSKDAMLDGLVEALYLELDEALAADPAGAEPDWRAELHRVARATHQVAMAHPHVVPLLATRMLAVPLARRPLAVLKDHERVLVLLEQAEVDESTASIVCRAITAWILGYAFVELQAMVDNSEETEPAFRLGLHRMPVQELPRLRKTAPAIAEHGGPEGLAAGLDALLDRFAPNAR
ncbi:TetR/AcrR family transcriptional regulator [Streptomyces lunaelactis]|uniref:TetR/AcrR family transcriptional regulator n=1 Tax=Streptomyces lunaelactis TaxID=1535768 RepID=UPI0015851A01|nr:TetR/AcrR family transcriptional regulator [Streptomyces lunaelactis]NUK04658.1 TetR/AcrR family transcriptional regulator [Streptomyces lunaelactis]NUK06506.1 TetR/AcrR family transcriptional regulator [Streptomyces lunaelactis]NUK17592.1 TetR/AcrR family transcriptional regulator [Streptomyces lunaelactis]NUK22902.1 TetR/AcrR family transcriptional regulator [Streptomyces lunaelactis]NUK35200.1 TetR/AcrR family transcriptional regulator [Streptomyces lunaelactis]